MQMDSLKALIQRSASRNQKPAPRVFPISITAPITRACFYVVMQDGVGSTTAVDVCGRSGNPHAQLCSP
jgi:hypothetical protein